MYIVKRAYPICGAVLCALACQLAPLEAATGEEGDFGCGPQALLISAALCDQAINNAFLRDVFPDEAKGACRLGDIHSAAEAAGLATRLMHLRRDDPELRDLPLVVPIRTKPSSKEPDHFVVLFGRRGRTIQVVDFPNRPRFVSVERLSKVWDGTGLYVAADPAQLPSHDANLKWVIRTLAIGVAIIGFMLLLARWIRSRKTHPDKAAQRG